MVEHTVLQLNSWQSAGQTSICLDWLIALLLFSLSQTSPLLLQRGGSARSMHKQCTSCDLFIFCAHWNYSITKHFSAFFGAPTKHSEFKTRLLCKKSNQRNQICRVIQAVISSACLCGGLQNFVSVSFLRAPQLFHRSSSQRVMALTLQNKTWHIASTLMGQRVTLGHQNMHYLAECKFWSGHNKKLVLSFVWLIAGDDSTPTLESGNDDGWTTASLVPLLHSVLLLKAFLSSSLSPLFTHCKTHRSMLLKYDKCLSLIFYLVCLRFFRYTEEEIRQKVSTFRQMLMDKEGVITREGSHTP